MNVLPKIPETGSANPPQARRICWFFGRLGATATAIGLVSLCPPRIVAADTLDWSQWRGENRDGVWHETGLSERFEAGSLQPIWSVPVAGGYSGPSVADGRVFVTDYLSEAKPGPQERLQCFGVEKGELLWSHSYAVDYSPIRYQAGPRASVLIHEGLAYSLGAIGRLVREGKSDRFWLFNERGELIIARLSPLGYEEVDRTSVIAPTRGQLNQRGGVVWTHPAFAHRRLFVRNDERLVCIDLSR